MGYKLHGRVIMMGHVLLRYSNSFALNVLELRGQVSKKIVCHHGLGFYANATYTLLIKEKNHSHFHCQLLK